MTVNLFQHHQVYKRLINIHGPRPPAGLCYLCDACLKRYDFLICHDCISDLPFIESSCPLCAMPSQTNNICAECLAKKRLFIDRTLGLFRYEYPVNQMIVGLKFHARQPLAWFFARMLVAGSAAGMIARPELFVPVPLHRSRLAERGFNQSLLIANHLSRLTAVPVDHRLCLRVRATRMQSGLSAKARRRNLKDAFSVNRGKSMPAHVAIIDDVVTTATTVTEMAKCLASAGVKRIDVWCCSRAAPGQP